MGSKRRICFVTGTRAEFGLMRPVLRAIADDARLRLQIIATGMHLDPRHGRGVEAIEADGWGVDHIVVWPAQSGRRPAVNARNTGAAMAGFAEAFAKLRSDIVLLVGDRVEPFAAAGAAHLAHIPIAHVHGGDRAIGQVDDALRHAITKLAHIHFPATAGSARRLVKLGEDGWRIRRVGSPGLDGIRQAAADWGELQRELPALVRGRYALVVLHPAGADAGLETQRAGMVADAVQAVGFDQIVVVYPNNDPGSDGIIRQWRRRAADRRYIIVPDVRRPVFLGLLRNAAVLAGNSSAGIIEAASFGTWVVDIGPRQQGRERSRNVIHKGYEARAIRAALSKVWNGGAPRRFAGRNVYGGTGTGRRIANHLATVALDERLVRKLIAY